MEGIHLSGNSEVPKKRTVTLTKRPMVFQRGDWGLRTFPNQLSKSNRSIIF